MHEDYGIVSDTPLNTFTQGPLRAVFVKTALPIIFVMSMTGLLAVADALFLGIYVGPEALGAVTMMFPAYMLVVALATLVAGGMASILARHLGAERYGDAQAIFAGAHGLALMSSAVLILLYALFGRDVTLLAADGSAALAEMGQVYLRITILFTPVLFVLSVNSDALRNEGRVGFMAAMSLLVSLANIGFNYVLIALLDMGVAGSAYGTALAQALAFLIILIFRLRGRTILRPNVLLQHGVFTGWGQILALGAPQSLNYMGLALGSATILAALQMTGDAGYETTVSAYGIITRIMMLVFLPLLGLSFAMQSITGNNYGAKLWRRSDDSLRLAIAVAFAYCLAVQIALTVFAGQIGGVFVDDLGVAREVARILPVIIALFFIAGPLVMIAAYFQAIGDARRAAILSLSKPYLFAIPLTLLLPLPFGEIGIWVASPIAEALMLVLTVCVLAETARRSALKWGLFTANRGEGS